MSQFQKYFQSIVEKNGLQNFDIYPTAGGEVALKKDGLTAFVWNDGRYPRSDQGFSINSVCTETITVLFGFIVMEIENNLSILKAGDTFVVSPNQKYSIAGKAVCQVDISPKWDSAQNSFTF